MEHSSGYRFWSQWQIRVRCSFTKHLFDWVHQMFSTVPMSFKQVLGLFSDANCCDKNTRSVFALCMNVCLYCIHFIVLTNCRNLKKPGAEKRLIVIYLFPSSPSADWFTTFEFGGCDCSILSAIFFMSLTSFNFESILILQPNWKKRF